MTFKSVFDEMIIILFYQTLVRNLPKRLDKTKDKGLHIFDLSLAAVWCKVHKNYNLLKEIVQFRTSKTIELKLFFKALKMESLSSRQRWNNDDIRYQLAISSVSRRRRFHYKLGQDRLPVEFERLRKLRLSFLSWFGDRDTHLIE